MTRHNRETISPFFCFAVQSSGTILSSPLQCEALSHPLPLFPRLSSPRYTTSILHVTYFFTLQCSDHSLLFRMWLNISAGPTISCGHLNLKSSSKMVRSIKRKARLYSFILDVTSVLKSHQLFLEIHVTFFFSTRKNLK